MRIFSFFVGTIGKSVFGQKLKSVESANVHLGNRRNGEIILKHSTAVPFKYISREFSCSFCCVPFDDLVKLRNHVDMNHKQFNIRALLHKFNVLNVDITDLKCTICSKEIVDLETILKHFSEEHNLPVNFESNTGVIPYKTQFDSFLCVYCSTVSANFINMKRHMSSHFQNFFCKSCNTSFVTDLALRLHVKKCQSSEVRFIYQLKHRNNAEIIMDNSTAYPFRIWAGKLSCVFCRNVFVNPPLLRHHLDSEHHQVDTKAAFYKCLRKDYLKIDITDLKCKICAEPFDDIETLAQHLKHGHNKMLDLDAQMGVLPFKLDSSLWKCLFCMNQFSDCLSLVRHTSEHFQNYVCHTCGQGFITKEALLLHFRTPHDNIFSCYRCSATFSTAEDRKCHIRERHTKTPYMCKICKGNPRFSSWDLKQKHMLEIHSSKPHMYECMVCRTTFKSRSAKYKHAQKVHPAQQFSCKYCNSILNSKVILDNHILKKHFNEMID